jgi:methionine sulfoxide reductase heme-binding subunit
MKFRFSVIQIITHVACLLPFAILIIGYFSHQLTVNPVREITLRTGRTAILIFLLSFGCRPIYQILKMDSLMLIRKSLGLYAALYAALHFINYIGLDFQFDWPVLFRLFSQQIFLLIGLGAVIMLIVLSFFSIPFLQKRVPIFWKNARILIYSSFGLSLLHFSMAVKGDKKTPLTYLVIFIIFMILRIPPFTKFRINIPPLQKVNSFLKFQVFPHG